MSFPHKGSGLSGLTYPQAVEECLCFGWVDGTTAPLDEGRWAVRFTPRRRGSVWSRLNVERARRLIEEGRMTPAGLRAYEARTSGVGGAYAHEQDADSVRLDEAAEALLRADGAAWAFWKAQPSSYRKQVAWWVMSAKWPGTRERRLATLVDDCRAGRRIAPLARGSQETAEP